MVPRPALPACAMAAQDPATCSPNRTCLCSCILTRLCRAPQVGFAEGASAASAVCSAAPAESPAIEASAVESFAAAAISSTAVVSSTSSALTLVALVLLAVVPTFP